MLRRFLCLAALAVPLLAGATAFAQDGGIGSWASSDFDIRIQSPLGAALSDFELPRFFNKARCDCDEPAFVFVGLNAAGFAKKTSGAPRGGSMEIWVGSDCGNTTTRARLCKQLDSRLFSTFLNEGTTTIEVSSRVLSTDPNELNDDGTSPGVFTPNPTCSLKKEKHAQTITVLLDTNNDGLPDTPFTTNFDVDLTPPPVPVVPPGTEGIQGGDQAVTITWQGIDTSIFEDLIGYQILCNRAGELQVFPDGSFEPGFQSCGETVGVGVEGLNPNFICSPLVSPSTRSFRVKILQDDIWYGVAVVAVDKSGNVSKPEIIYGKPMATKSFYDVYRDGYNGTMNGEYKPGEASGGFCSLGREGAAAGTAFGLAGAAAALAAVLVRRRRRP